MLVVFSSTHGRCVAPTAESRLVEWRLTLTELCHVHWSTQQDSLGSRTNPLLSNPSQTRINLQNHKLIRSGFKDA